MILAIVFAASLASTCKVALSKTLTSHKADTMSVQQLVDRHNELRGCSAYANTLQENLTYLSEVGFVNTILLTRAIEYLNEVNLSVDFLTQPAPAKAGKK